MSSSPPPSTPRSQWSPTRQPSPGLSHSVSTTPFIRTPLTPEQKQARARRLQLIEEGLASAMEVIDLTQATPPRRTIINIDDSPPRALWRDASLSPSPTHETYNKPALRDSRLRKIEAGLQQEGSSRTHHAGQTLPHSDTRARYNNLPSQKNYSTPITRPAFEPTRVAPKPKRCIDLTSSDDDDEWQEDATPTVAPPSSFLATIPPVSQADGEEVKVPVLSQQQRKILHYVDQGMSVFYTGSAGTGKSVLLREIIQTLNTKYKKTGGAVAITASTGIAACNIGGRTLHSFAGIGLGDEEVEELIKKLEMNKKGSDRWKNVKVLIIDEISMVDADLFDKLAEIACRIRGNNKPFGGIQLVITGDFFQLPPVSKTMAKFAFEAKKWSECVPRTYTLTRVFRQTDQKFIDMLTEMRHGIVSKETVATFRALSRPVNYGDGIQPTELFSLREHVQKANMARHAALVGKERVYTSKDTSYAPNGSVHEKLFANFMAPETLKLKLGSQVMLIVNRDENLVNGSVGLVTGFSQALSWRFEGNEIVEPKGTQRLKAERDEVHDKVEYPIVRFTISKGVERELLVKHHDFSTSMPMGAGKVVGKRNQLPLILAWAMSIHKSQGQTIERVKVDLDRVFEKGQVYVALSRATCLEGLQVLNFKGSTVLAHPKVVQWTQTLTDASAP